MEFTRQTQQSTFNSPLADFDRVTKEVEIREDPLTGRTARVVDGAFPTPDEYDIEPAVSDDDGCFFCPGTVEDATPTYPDWFGTDRGTRGEAVSFPNLNPYGSYSNVVVLTETHFQPIEEFTLQQFVDGFALALDFIIAVREHDEAITGASINMNFLRPAGSTIVHPHLQTLLGDARTTEQRRLLEASRRYQRDNDDVYWQDLVDAETDGDRWIATTADVDWLAPFAPRHHRNVLGVLDETGIPDPDSRVVRGVAEGVRNVLESYADIGLNAFNLALHIPNSEAMPPVVTIVARSVFDEYYWSDSPFFTVLHDESIVETPPEEYAAETSRTF